MRRSILLSLVCLVGLLGTGCPFVLGPQAPIEDGSYLSYDLDGTSIRITFTRINNSQFTATTEYGSGGGTATETVDRQLKTPRGSPFESDYLGPLWIPPGQVKVGGKAYGDRVDEVKHWEKWDVGVVKASFGVGGALSGEWYYDKNTGFLVGGHRSSVISTIMTGKGSRFILKDSNLAGLSP